MRRDPGRAPKNDATSDEKVVYSAAQLEAGIKNALAAHDVKAAHDILQVLAMVDAKRAADVLTVIEAGLILAKEHRA